MPNGQSERLFRVFSLYQSLQNEEARINEAIDSLEGHRLLNTSPTDLCDYFVKEHTVAVPVLLEADISVSEPGEQRIRTNNTAYNWIFDDDRPVTVAATTIKLYIPFSGDKALFLCQPSSSAGPPTAPVEIEDSELIITYTRTDHDGASLKREMDGDLAGIRDNLQNIAREVLPFNDSLRAKVTQRIESRREKLLKDQGLAANLGFPIRRRPDAPQTYTVPVIQRKMSTVLPGASNAPFQPEPALESAEYEHILGIISNMVLVMERSPKAFRHMGEEDLRQHFLVQLNGQYEGQASGETFNYEGKTDILIRVNGKNVFLAECKIWRGPEKLTETLDQLLGYATWRDTKTAVVVFNRNKDFSAVLSKIPEVVQAHPDFKHRIDYSHASGFRYIFSHRDDTNRDLILTILAFDVPTRRLTQHTVRLGVKRKFRGGRSVTPVVSRVLRDRVGSRPGVNRALGDIG